MGCGTPHMKCGSTNKALGKQQTALQRGGLFFKTLPFMGGLYPAVTPMD